MPLRNIVKGNRDDIALVIGNGSNRFGNARNVNSWDRLLLNLGSKYNISGGQNSIPEGITLTEFYDLLELKTPSDNPTKIYLQKEFCAGMADWKVFPHHERIVRWAQSNSAPILTTNFDSVFSRVGNFQLFPERNPSFTDYYPWERYYAESPIARPDLGFGIWHINGMEKYRRSIRLGLTHYMGSVERVRNWIHKGNERRLFAGKNINNWEGVNTWVHVIFNKPLLIFGLGLEENEVFLRWLLIERARYFRKFPERKKKSWFIYVSDEEKTGKLYFLENLGIDTVKVSSYEEIYGPRTWE